MELIVSEKRTPNGIILVITDKNILNNVYEEGIKQLDLTKEFYKGEEKSKEEIIEMIKRAYILHLTGDKAISLAKEINLVDENHILIIKNVPHAEILLDNTNYSEEK